VANQHTDEELVMPSIEQTQVEWVDVDSPSVDIDVDRSIAVKADGLQEELTDMADSFDVTGFKCVKCGLAHMHDTMKHRLSDTFDIDESTAAMIFDYNPVCHCGVQEAGRHGSDIGIDEREATNIASKAPIPPEASREMNNEYGSL